MLTLFRKKKKTEGQKVVCLVSSLLPPTNDLSIAILSIDEHLDFIFESSTRRKRHQIATSVSVKAKLYSSRKKAKVIDCCWSVRRMDPMSANSQPEDIAFQSHRSPTFSRSLRVSYYFVSLTTERAWWMKRFWGSLQDSFTSVSH